MRVTILSSGSSGNTLLIESRGTRVFIDAGLRGRRLRQRLLAARAELAGEALPASAAFLTHEHGDHAGGAEELAERGLQLYATAGTARALAARARPQVREIIAGEPVRHGDLTVHPLAVPHDAAEPVAYVISDGEVRLGVLTDCGHPSDALAQAFAGCAGLVLETNHDPGLLRGGPYPRFLKERIAADHGHLSNQQGAELLRGVLRCAPGLRVLVCAHLSRTNNRPELALGAVQRVLGRRPVAVLVAEQDRALAPIELVPGGVRGGAAAQLALPF